MPFTANSWEGFLSFGLNSESNTAGLVNTGEIYSGEGKVYFTENKEEEGDN